MDGNRDVAQLVAHYVRDVGVASSNLVIPTRRVRILVTVLLILLSFIGVLLLVEFNPSKTGLCQPHIDVLCSKTPILHSHSWHQHNICIVFIG